MSSLKKQSSMQAQFSRHVGYIKKIPATVSLYELEERLKGVVSLYEEFRQVQDEVESEIGDEFISHQYQLRNQVEDYYYLISSELRNEIDKIKLAQQPPQVQRNENNNNTVDLKLPRIEIPIFKGDYKARPEFKDLFESLIHDNDKLKNVQKFQHLKNALGGKAKGLIKSLHMTDANYQEAWRRIHDRYQHKRFIVESHLDTLFGLQPIQTEDAMEIKQLIDDATEAVGSLQVLGIPVNQWDAILVHIVSSKLDTETHKQWELTLKKDELPTFHEKEEFLEARWQSLEMIENSKSHQPTETQQSTKHRQFNNKNHNGSTQQSMSGNTVKSSLCINCNKAGHMTGFCSKYISLSHESKMNFVKSNKLCFNCLRPNHSLASCLNKASCSNCGKRHHTSLHLSNKPENETNEQRSQNIAGQSSHHITQSQPHQAHAVTSNKRNQSRVLLSTAIVNVIDSSGFKIPARALIDKGGDHSIIQEKFAKQLGLVHHKEEMPIVGIGEVVVQAETQLVRIVIESIMDADFKMEVEAYTMRSITGNLPSVPINRQEWPHLKGVTLADNQYEDIVLEGIIRKQENSPTAINSRLGWLLFGKVEAQLSAGVGLQIHHVSQKKEPLEEALRSFWELEEVPATRKCTVKEQQAEEIFQQSKYRNEEGRYVVALPFDPSKASEELGDSRAIAVQCLYRLEKRFQSNSTIKERYINYIQALLDSKHAELVPAHCMDVSSQSKFYLPHHPVLKESSITTRVVFNASQKTRSGISLIEKLLVGPKIEDELFDILIRWRKHFISFLADIEKMYRQVEIIEDHRDYQRFLWRFSPNNRITEYRITRVIDGTAPAQFLATRAVRQLAEDSRHQYPEAAKVIHEDFYIDDLSSGSHDIKSAMKLQDDIINVLKGRGFVLKKWLSNSKEVLENVPKENQHDPEILVEIIENGVKTLGVLWNQKEDVFQFKVTATKVREQTSKRKIMSDACKLFDPIGWLSPVTVVAKIFLQSLWTLSDIGWDDSLPEHKLNEWQMYRNQLSSVENIKIPRWIGYTPVVRIQLHGFADASNLAYAAVVYTRVILSDGSIIIKLISSKTKVAPLKTITTPKLELCGCLLLATLVSRVNRAFNFNSAETFLYSDSTTALAWITSHPNHWNIFVANRITDIQQQSNIESWRFVETNQNPADCASRGVKPDELKDHPLWWNGPTWLKEKEEKWPIQPKLKFETELE